MINNKIVIGYVSFANPFLDRKAWSGTVYKLRESINKAGFEVIWIPVKKETMMYKFWKIVLKILRNTTKKNYLSGVHFPPHVRTFSKSVASNKDIEKCDFLFFPSGAQIAIYLDVNKPIIYHADASAYIMDGYYWENISKLSIKLAKKLEMEATQKALINIRSSDWAINSVIKDCFFSPNNSYVLELGPNIDTKDITRVKPYEAGELRIFFSGVDWSRKGGDIAVETVIKLREAGIDAKLYIAGIKTLPDYCSHYNFIINLGFFDKNIPEQYSKLIKSYSVCHIFLLPTKAECAGVVFSEATAFGMPSYTYSTGGTPNYVVDGVNGRLLSLKKSGEDFAQQIYNDIKSGELSRLYVGTKEMYAEKLSWEAWSRRFASIMNKYI